MHLSNLAKNLIKWYRLNARDLPWRHSRDPYKIWLSEIILQQTRVNQGLPYYLNFSKNFPTLNSLAEAPEEHILRSWQGLGYYSRARNLQKCAKLIVNDLDGKFPENYEELKQLPGIGPYTAAAIASIAFKKPVAAIDGNALRVFTRLWGIAEDISKNGTINLIRDKANHLIPEDSPADFNQGVMELGATICLPKSPKCNICPLVDDCHAFKNKEQDLLPVKRSKVKIRNRYFNYFIIRKGESIALFLRTGKDIWKGLYDFYLVESEALFDPAEITNPFITDYLNHGAQIDIHGPDVKHILSHQVIYCRFFEVELNEKMLMEPNPESPVLNFYSQKEVLDLPKPVLVNNFLNYYYSNDQETI